MRRLYIAIALLLCIAAATRAQELISTPKDAAKSFAEALIEGDADEAMKFFDGDEDSKALIEPMAAASIAYKKAAEAAERKFKEAARDVYADNRNSFFLRKIEISNETISPDGNKATLERKRVKEDPIRLRKVSGEWKISKLPDAVIEARGEIVAMTKALEAVAKGIEDGEFATAAESHEAIKKKTRELAAATQPTTRAS